jgi:hypothetical protein
MYKTSRKAESAFSHRAKDIIKSRRMNRIVNEQRQLSIKQNELDMEQLYLIEDLASNIVENGESQYFVTGKYLEMYFANPNLELTEEEIKEIESQIPEGHKKNRFIQYGTNPTIRKILYFTLVMTVIATVIVPVEGYCGSRQACRRQRECRRKWGKQAHKKCK